MSEDLPAGSSATLHDIARWTATWLFRPGIKLKVHGAARVPRSGPVVMVANHSAMVDGPILFGAMPRRAVFLIKQEMFTGPLGWFLLRIGQLAVRRGEPDRTPLLAAVRVLRGGGLVGVFPEGTRGPGDVQTAQNGAAWLARSADALVLPVACRGTYRAPGSGRRWRPRVDVLIGAPFTVSTERGRTGLTIATAQVRDALVAVVADLDRLRAGTGRMPAANVNEEQQ
jgi:1-acyl-sn-glycerol-3-phosphate acyltransferase